MSDVNKQIDPAGYVYLSLADDPTVIMFMREMQTQLVDERIEWEAAPTLHVTLAYAPSVSTPMLAEIARSLHLPDWAGVDFDGIGVFENGASRAMHLRAIPNQVLRDVQRQVFEAFITRGIEVSPYSVPEAWKAHVTLAYLPPDLVLPEFPSWGAGAVSNKLIIGRDDYETFAEITAVQIKSKSIEVAAKAEMLDTNTTSNLRHMLIITSNAYEDREGEIVSQKALAGYVESSWKGDNFIGDNPLLLWHGGEPIGEIVYADMHGPFLIEVARELPNHTVNLAKKGEEPLNAEVKAVWDALAIESNLGASHEFMFIMGDREDNVYDTIIKKESSVLPDWAAANYFTDAEIVGEAHG